MLAVERSHAVHRMDICAARILIKNMRNLPKTSRITGIAFASGAKDIEVVLVLQHHAHLAPKDRLEQLLFLIPRYLARKQNC